MAMPMVAPRYTIADLERFPDDGNRYELLGGVLLVTPMAGPPHQVVLGRLMAAISAYLGTSRAAFAISPGAIQIGKDTQLEPDLLVIPARFQDCEDWHEMSEWWLAVEVSGPTSRIYDRDFKSVAYLQAGVREVWRADLRDRTVSVSRPGEPAEVPHAERLAWHPPGMEEPLVLEVQTIFPPARPS
jgi:Uma2 family endonuclease